MATRPSIPVLMPLALSFWIACALLLQALRGADVMMCLGLSAISCVVLVGCAAAVFRYGASTFKAIVLGVVLGCALAGAAAVQMKDHQQAVEDAPASLFIFRVVEDPQAGDFGDSCIATTMLDNGMTVRVRVNLLEGHDVKCWDTFSAQCRIKPGSVGAGPYYWQKRCAGTVTIHSYTRSNRVDVLSVLRTVRQIGTSLFAQAGGKEGALLQALVLGDRGALFASDFYGDVKAAGLAHIVAVSGSHLAVVIASLVLLLRVIGCPRRVAFAIEVVFICAFVLLTGAPQSAIRSAIMVVCGLAAFFAQRRASALNALSVCALIMIAADPFLSLSVSLALSAGATLGIILFARYFSEWCACCTRGRFRLVCDIIGMTCAATMLTLPLSVSAFGQLPLVSPLANVIATPLFTLLCVGGSITVALAIVLPATTVVTVPCMAAVAGVFCQAVTACAHLPAACVPATGSFIVLGLVAGIVCWALWAAWPQPRAAGVGAAAAMAIAAAAVFLVLLPGVHGDEIVMIDVGQGDALLVRTARNALLIDTGNQDAALLAGLARNDVRSLDAVVLTHADDDHCGSLSALLDVVSVGRICVAADLMECTAESCVKLRGKLEGHQVELLEAHDSLYLGGFTATVVSPAGYSHDGGNADSLVLSVSDDANRDGRTDWTALFCGDAESEVLDRLAAQGSLNAVDIFKVGHHGSKAAVDEAVMDTLSPQISLVSVGANNRYGHPAQKTIDTLAASGSQVLRTDRSGDVICSLQAEQMSVRTLR